MHTRHFSIALTLIVSIVLAAGCVGQSGGISIPGFGSDVVKTESASTTTGVADVITLENVQTLPSGQILPEQSARLLMNIVSKDTDPTRPINNVFIKLYDAPVFYDMNRQLCNVVGCQPSQCASGSPCSLYPSEVKPIEFDMLAPTSDEIKNIITRPTLSWLTQYSYTSSTNYDMLIVSEDEILRLQQLGQTLSVPLQNIQSAGPIRIDMSMPTTFGIAGKTTNQVTYLVVTLRNVGSGFPVSTSGGLETPTTTNVIPPGKLVIVFPQDLGAIEGLGKMSGCTGSPCTNSQPIEFFRQETIPLQIKITPNKEDQLMSPHRTFTIGATVEYDYQIRGATTLEIRPPRV